VRDDRVSLLPVLTAVLRFDPFSNADPRREIAQ
jgi:hypothetical protein